MKARLAVLPGDGIGPEVTAAAVSVLRAVAARGGHDFAFSEHAIGGCAIDAHGDPLPAETLIVAKQADAVLLGAVGGPKWSDPNARLRPEQGLLRLRAELGVFANLRPVKVHPTLAALSPLKADRLAGVDVLIVRELTGGAYFGAKARTAQAATDETRYTVAEIERVLRRAFQLARGRSRRVTSVDKANVLETSRLWREVSERVVRGEFPDCSIEHMFVDAAAMHLLRRPRDFDVLLTENLFGDILTDEAAMLAGSLGVLPSASLGEGRRGLYEPIHGSAPDIAGRGIANPIGAIWAGALLLEHLGQAESAERIVAAIERVLREGRVLTPDLGGRASTRDVTAAVLEALA